MIQYVDLLMVQLFIISCMISASQSAQVELDKFQGANALLSPAGTHGCIQ
jgi:hypothetical protein